MTRKVLERAVKQINVSGNGLMVHISKEARTIKLKANDKVQVSAIKQNNKEFILIEKLKDLQ